jgi:hypothetical protein
MEGQTMALDVQQSNSMSRSAMKAELLDAETELKLAYAWRDERDEEALHRLINAYMRLAISMAAKFKRYGAPMNDLIQEAGLGLMKLVDGAHRVNKQPKIAFLQHETGSGAYRAGSDGAGRGTGWLSAPRDDRT